MYWEDGAQITPPHDKNILEEVAKVTEFSQVKTMAEGEAKEQGLLQMIGEEIDDLYMEQLKKAKYPSGTDSGSCKGYENCLYATSWYR